MKLTSHVLLLLFLCLLLPLTSLYAQDQTHEHTEIEEEAVIALSKPTLSTDSYDIFGGELGTADTMTSLAVSVQLDFTDREEADLHFEGTLTEVCQTRGCNFFLDDGEHQIRVRFLDYGFFIPTDSAGRKGIVRGDFVQKTDEETGDPFVEILASSIKIFR